VSDAPLAWRGMLDGKIRRGDRRPWSWLPYDTLRTSLEHLSYVFELIQSWRNPEESRNLSSYDIALFSGSVQDDRPLSLLVAFGARPLRT
jgi:hypothetical protein